MPPLLRDSRRHGRATSWWAADSITSWCGTSSACSSASTSPAVHRRGLPVPERVVESRRERRAARTFPSLLAEPSSLARAPSAAACSSTARSASAATPRPCSKGAPEARLVGIDRDPRRRSAARPPPARASATASASCRPTSTTSRSVLRRRRRRAGRRAARRSRSVLAAARYGGARLQLPARGAARHAHGARRTDGRRDRQRILGGRTWRRSCGSTAKSETPGGSRAPSSRRASERRSKPPELREADRTAPSGRRERARSGRSDRSRDPVFQALRIEVNQELEACAG